MGSSLTCRLRRGWLVTAAARDQPAAVLGEIDAPGAFSARRTAPVGDLSPAASLRLSRSWSDEVIQGFPAVGAAAVGVDDAEDYGEDGIGEEAGAFPA